MSFTVMHVEAGKHLYGGALQVIFLMRGLAQQGVHSLLVCPPGSAIGEEASRLGIPGLKVLPLQMKGDADIGLTWRLMALMRQHHPQVLHLHSRRGADLWGLFAGRLAGVPTVLSRRVDNPEPPWWARRKYHLPQRVVAISQGIRQVLLSEGVAPDQVVCVPSAVDTTQWQPAEADERERRRRAICSEFNFPGDALLVGMAAQFIERKGHATLLDALPAVLDAQPHTRVLLFGQGPLTEAIAQRVQADTRLREAVRLTGFRRDLAQLLPALDLMVHPASMEGLGVALLQAAACGLPMVAGRAGGIPEIVRPGLNGELITPGDVAALAQHMTRLLGSASARSAYGAAARAWVQQHFSIDAMVAGNLAVYRSLPMGNVSRR